MRRVVLVVAVVGAAFASSMQTAGATSRITATPKLSVSGKPAVAGSATTLRLGVALAHGDRVAKYSLKYGDVSHLVTGKKVPGTLRHVFGRPGKYTATLTITDIHHRTTHTSVRFTVPPIYPDGYKKTQSLPFGYTAQAADLDGNGTTDLVLTNAQANDLGNGVLDGTDGSITVDLGDAHGHFRSLPVDQSINAVRAQIADMNGDGIPDLVLTESSVLGTGPEFPYPTYLANHSYGIALGDGRGGFTLTSLIGVNQNDVGVVVPALADLGGAGPSLVEGQNVYPTDGHGNFTYVGDGLSSGPFPAGTFPVKISSTVTRYLIANGSSLAVISSSDANDFVVTTATMPGNMVGKFVDLGNGSVAVVTTSGARERVTTVDLSASPTVTSSVLLPADFVGGFAPEARLDLNGDGRTDFVSTAGSIAFGAASGYVSGGRMPKGVALATDQFLLLDSPSGYDVVARS